MPDLPQRTRVYQCHHFDSTRWDYFESRDDDIIIATSYKAGTTWAQAILAHLLFPDGDLPSAPAEMSPWLDMRVLPLEVALNNLRAQKHRRFRYAPGGGQFWKGGADTFLHKGTNGRWRDVLSDEEMTLYDAACERALTPECRQWLENGGGIPEESP